MHVPDNIVQWVQCIQDTLNSKTFVLFISACAVSFHLGFPDVWSLAKATPSSGLLDIWKFQTSGQSPLFMWTTFLGWKREYIQKPRCMCVCNLSRNPRQGEDTFSVIKKRALKKKTTISYWRTIADECQIPLWASQNLLHISFCLGFCYMSFHSTHFA